jgi:hypothetical protein
MRRQRGSHTCADSTPPRRLQQHRWRRGPPPTRFSQPLFGSYADKTRSAAATGRRLTSAEALRLLPSSPANDWRLETCEFQFFEHPVHFTREQAYEGKYIIQTEEKNLSAFQAVELYKKLSEVERALANIKDVIEMRPIYHRDADRVCAHIFAAVLAFVLHRAI